MKNLKELKAEAVDLLSRVDAICAFAKEQNRQRTPEENKEIDAIQARLDEKTGDLALEIARQERIEELRAQCASKYVSHVAEVSEEIANGVSQQASKIVVPATAKRHGDLKAFVGEDADRNAYVAGHVFAASLYGSRNSQKWLDDHGITAALHTGEDSKGGVFVPVETETAIIRLVEQYGTFRRKARIESMGSDRKVVPVRVSGLTAYPVAETNGANQSSNTGTESEPIYTNIELVARKWKTLTRMSDELNEDALISMADQLSVEIALAFAYAEDNAAFNGDGSSTYQGVVGIKNALNAGSKYTAATGNTAFSTLDLADFEAMVGQMPEFPNAMPEWYISKKGYYASMHRLQMAAGGNGAGDIQSGGRPVFLSFPVNFVQCMNATLDAQTSTTGLAYLADLAMGAILGDRRGVQIKLTDQRYWDVDQIGVKATERFDINIHSRGTATAAGAIIALVTPGS